MLRVKRPVYHRWLFEGGKACLPSGEAFIRSIVLKPHHNFSASEVRVRMPWRDTVRPSREDKVRDTDVPFKSFDQHASLFLGLPSVNIILIGVLGEEAYIQGMQSVGH